MRIRLFLLVITTCFICNAVAADKDHSFTLYLVRHAEKQADGSRDPALTSAGKHRAQQLAYWLRDKGIKDVWSSQFARTRDTAKPLLSDRGLDLNIYDPGNQEELVRQLLKKRHTALVVGHSNTIPELARLLCKCHITNMDESEHDRLILALVTNTGVQIRTLQQNGLFQPQD